MPTYEYACAKCKHEFEKVQSIKEASLRVCPKEDCPRKPWGKGKVQRRISTGGGLIFKGTGFYTTDYRSENYKTAAKKDTDAQKPAKTETKGEASTTTKPAAASAPATPPSSPAPAAKKVSE
jgi:putative FmdB family regulatory protein